jgi:hypothetical protein
MHVGVGVGVGVGDGVPPPAPHFQLGLAAETLALA